MKAKKTKKMNVIYGIFRLFFIVLLGGLVLFPLNSGQVKAEVPSKNHKVAEKQDSPQKNFGMVFLKNRTVKIYGFDSYGSTFKMKFRSDEYDMYDSVLVIHKKIDRWFCFSLKTGVISKSYTGMGSPGSQAGANLIACVDNDGRIGFLDCHTGKEVIPCCFYYDKGIYDEGYEFAYNAPCFDGNTCLLYMVSFVPDIYCDCIIDMTGKVLLDGFLHINKAEYFDGYIMDCDSGLESLYTKDLRCVLANKADISEYKVGIVYTDSLESIPMLMDFDLTRVTPVYTLFDIAECRSLNVTYGDQKQKSDDEYYTFDIDYRLGAGVIDQDMNLVIDPRWKWDRVVPIGNGYFVCYSEETGFLMDRNGNFVVPKIRKK